jgi:hypothetical protein
LDEFKKTKILIDRIKISRQVLLESSRFTRGIFFNFLSETGDPVKILKHIVERRGFLHHHTGKKHDIWHPERQERFDAEAKFLQDVCHQIAYKQVGEIFFREEFARGFWQMSEQAGAIFVATVSLHLRFAVGVQQSQDVPIRIPGTKGTHNLAQKLAREAFIVFEKNSPPDTDLLGFDVKAQDGSILATYRNLIPPA